jgi:hypothetical protein
VALEVERRMEARDVIRILDAAVLERGGAPEYIRSDNGPEFVALAVQDWIARRGFKTLYIEPGAPWQNAYSESFNSRFRDEFLNREAFASVLEAKVLGKQHGSGTTMNDPTRRWNTRRLWSSRSAALRLPPLRFGGRQAAPFPPTTSPPTQTPKTTKNSHSEWIKNRGQATAVAGPLAKEPLYSFQMATASICAP